MSKRAIIQTEAVVLRTLEYGETSQIVTLFTQEKGRITVMAKGARRPDSSFGAALQPMAYTHVVFYYKPTRSMQTLSESALIEPMQGISRSLHKITIGLRVVELLRALLEDEDPQPAAFALTIQTLRCLNTARDRAGNVWPYFQLRLANHLGLAPSVARSAVNQVPEDGGLLSLESGTVLPTLQNASQGAVRQASRSALRAFAIFARADLDSIMRMRLTPAVRREAEQLVDEYMRYQFESAYPSKCSEVISQLMDAPSASRP